MMAAIRQYILSIVIAVLISSIMVSLAGKGMAGEWIRLLCGLYLTVTLLNPMIDFDWSAVLQVPALEYQEAAVISAEGKSMAQQARNDIIKKDLEAYILDKAASLNAQIQTEVTVNKDGIPVQAGIFGDIEDETKSRLEAYIETELGITKEHQIWSG